MSIHEAYERRASFFWSLTIMADFLTSEFDWHLFTVTCGLDEPLLFISSYGRHTGICGAPHIVDVGGPAYLEPLPQLNKLYSFKEIGRLINRDGCFCLGWLRSMRLAQWYQSHVCAVRLLQKIRSSFIFMTIDRRWCRLSACNGCQ
jgi:hypothetical protein